MTNPKPLSLAELEVLLPRLRATVELAEVVAGPLAKYVEAMESANGHSAPRVKRAPLQLAPKQAQKKTTERLSGAALQDRVHDVLKGESKGIQVAAIAKVLGVEPEPVRYALARLRDDKRAKMTGKFNLAMWHARS